MLAAENGKDEVCEYLISKDASVGFGSCTSNLVFFKSKAKRDIKS
jgi:hypothetical protein